MKLYDVYLGLGSNIGAREMFLNDAAGELQKLEDSRVVGCSPIYETDPIGKTDQPKFLNAVLQFETPLPPAELFSEVKRIENEIGRSICEKWGPREIDIDILIYDGLVFKDGQVEIPHPELEKRKFVLVPLRDVASDLVHPVSGLTVDELAFKCQHSGRVVRSSHKIVF